MPPITEEEVAAILADESKAIDVDIMWENSPAIHPAVEFRVEVISDGDYPLIIRGWFNPATGKLSFALIAQGVGRIYGLDFGASHRNPGGAYIGDPHKNTWKDGLRDKYAYSPSDITANWWEPVIAWQQFCREANVRHSGTMAHPESQGELTL